ncbi:MAG: CusA/CzcA family heavy metal efflux RND transporter [Candidatus Glassbacteria bacterium]
MFDRLIKFSLKNRLLLAVVAVALVGYGYYSYSKLPVDAFPDVSPNLVQVFTETEGLAPEEVETYVTYPVEVAMNGLPGLKEIRSVSNFGLSVVNVYFEDEIDIYFARQLVNERLQEAREQIPEGFGNPQMGPISTGMGLILFYYLEDTTGKRSLEELRIIQDWLIKYHLQTVPGVTEVLGIGGYERQFQVIVDPDGLLRYGVTLSELIERIKQNNLNTGAQFIVKNDEEFVIRSVGLVTGVADLKMIVMKSVDGVPVYLGDMAEIKTGGAVRRGVQTRNGITEVVSGQVIKLFGSNSSVVIARVEEKLKEINRILPEGIRIVPYYDQKTLVEECVSTVVSALFQGILLVVAVLFFFMGSIRPSLVAAAAIPFSVLFSFILMRYLGISANLMSLGGVAIAIGMMTDGAVVLVENTDRTMESLPLGDRKEAVSQASREVIRPVVFAILIIVVVFLPLFALQGVEGKTFRPLAYTVALSMFGSIIFAVFFVPVLASLLMKGGSSGRLKNRLMKLESRIEEILVKAVVYFVGHRQRAVWLVTALLIIGVIGLSRLGSEFTPELQEGTLVLRTTMAPSISLEKSKETALVIERKLMEIPEITEVVTRIGRGELGAHTDPVNNAETFIRLKPRSLWQTADNQEDLERAIREHLGEIPGILLNFTQPIAMNIDELLEGVRAELAIKLFGDDLDTLKYYADEIAGVVSSVPGAEDVQPDQVSGAPQLLIRIDRQAIARYGVNISEVQEVIRAAVGGVTASQILEGVRRFDILVRYPEQYRAAKDDIARILIMLPSGLRIPLGQLATLEEVVGPRQITRQNNQRFISVQCNVVGRDIGSFVEEATERIMREVDLPASYLLNWGGTFRLQQEANQRLVLIVPVTLILIFFLLYMNFGSMKCSLLILMNIPFALVGGVVALWLSGQNLSVPSSVGFIALLGIAVLNGIVLVTYINQLVKEGRPVQEASVTGTRRRIRPVLMTAALTALGLLPLLFSHGTGSEVQKPLATVVVGGLITSTALTLLVLPALYKWFVNSESR